MSSINTFLGVPNDSEESDAGGNYTLPKIIKNIKTLYTKSEIGILDTAKSVKRDINRPPEKITVLLVGDDEEGKRKFLNSYFADSRSDAFISRRGTGKLSKVHIIQGNQRKLLKGNDVFDVYPHLSELRNLPELQNHLITEVASVSEEDLVSFVIAPSPIPFHSDDLSATINPMKSLVDAAQLVFIFFDPSGRIPAEKTLKPFEGLWDDYHEKFHILLADTSDGSDVAAERETVLANLTNAIWRHPCSRRTGFIPPIYCPDLTRYIGQSDKLRNAVNSALLKSVDDALQTLKQDAEALKYRLEVERKNNELLGGIKSEFLLTRWLVTTLLVFVIFIGLLAMGQMFLKEYHPARWVQINNDYGEYLDPHEKFGLHLHTAMFVVAACISGGFWYNWSTIMKAICIPTLPDHEALIEQRINFLSHALLEKEKMQGYIDSLKDASWYDSNWL